MQRTKNGSPNTALSLLQMTQHFLLSSRFDFITRSTFVGKHQENKKRNVIRVCVLTKHQNKPEKSTFSQFIEIRLCKQIIKQLNIDFL